MPRRNQGGQRGGRQRNDERHQGHMALRHEAAEEYERHEHPPPPRRDRCRQYDERHRRQNRNMPRPWARDRFTVASPWTGHIPVLPTMTFVVLAAAVASGRRWMLVPLVFFGSLMTQSHVALVPLVIALSAAALAALIATRHQPVARLTPALQTSAWLLALLWFPPIAEQMSHEPGNLARLWSFFVGPGHAGKPFSTAVSAWSYATVGVLRPDLYTPYGGHFEVTHLGWGIPVA